MTFRGTPEEIAALKIGDTLYHFDGNRRTYLKGITSGPVYSKHFEAVQIVGDTKLSWIMDRYSAKVSKKALESAMHYADRGYFTKSAMEADIWLHHHRHKIAREVETANVTQLQEIARIVGYRAPVSQS